MKGMMRGCAGVPRRHFFLFRVAKSDIAAM